MIFKINHKSKAILTDVLAHQAQLDGEKIRIFLKICVKILILLISTVVLNHRKMDVVGMNFQILFLLEISLLHVGTMQITQR